MASSTDGGGGGGGGGANQGFDMNKLFKPSSNPPIPSSPNLTTSPSFPLPSSSVSPTPSPYLTPSSSYPPPTGPYSFHHHLHNNIPNYLPYPPPPTHFANMQPQQLLNNRASTPPPISYPPPPAPQPGNDILTAFFDPQQLPSPHMDMPPQQPMSMLFSTSAPPPLSAGASEFFVSTSSNPIPSAPPINLAVPAESPMRMLSTKLPRGRHLTSNHGVYDINARLPGEVQPQLEVTPITRYNSDPGLFLGRQIAVNRKYICYGLKLGAIRILNINTALRSLLRGHAQRVTDMAFFAEDVNLLASSSVDGCVFIWKIREGPDVEDKDQIVGKTVISMQIAGEWESANPRVCWHPHKQEILIVAIGNSILKINTRRAGQGKGGSAEEPLKFSIDKLIDGVQSVGKHDGEITELSMCQWMMTRLASASLDGTVKIWEDRKALPVAVLRPYDGHPVNSVTFFTNPENPEHIVLITGGPLNRELKLWTSASEHGWLLEAESWQCTQTLELKSSAEPRIEDAFFNQAIALPRAGLFLLANAKKNAIYAVHIDYGSYPVATRMDYIAEFTVTIPILSLTGTSESAPVGEHHIQIYCVQTAAIQQYALLSSQCHPPPLEVMDLENTVTNASRTYDAANSDTSSMFDSFHGSKSTDIPVNATSETHKLSSNSEITPVVSNSENVVSSEVVSLQEMSSSVQESKLSAVSTHFTTDVHTENVQAASPPLPLSPRLSRKLSGFRSPPSSFEPCSSPTDRDQPLHKTNTAPENHANPPSSSDNLSQSDKNIVQSDISMVPDPPVVFKHPTHLVTPSELLSKTAASSESSQNIGEVRVQEVIANNDSDITELEDKVVDEAGSVQNHEGSYTREPQGTSAVQNERPFYSQASDLGIQMGLDFCTKNYDVEGSQQANNVSVIDTSARSLNTGKENDQVVTKNVPAKVGGTEASMVVQQSATPSTKGKKQKGKTSQVTGPSSPSPSPFDSTDSSNGPGCSSGATSTDAALPQLVAIQHALDQLMSGQKDMQKHFNAMVSAPITKEGKRLEISLSRTMEKIAKANSDALWARFHEESAKQEKLERDRTQQLTNLITNCINKDLPAILEKTFKKEIAAVGPALTRSITPTIEKSISSAITESFQKGVGEKAVTQLEKSVSSKLEATVARQIQAQFQTSGKQALQDALTSSLEASIIPAFELSCKAMFEKIDATFQKGLVKYTTSAQQQFESSHSSLAIALRDSINSASSITQTLSGELAEGQRKLFSIAAAGANSQGGNPLVAQLSNGPLLHEMADAPLDPTKELSRLVAERKYEEAFTSALHRSDVTIVSWLCSQVDLSGILSMVPLPLNQGVLLALLQQISCDISTEMGRKLGWMTDVAVAINPTDPMITMHVRPIFDQVYQTVSHQRNQPGTSPSDLNSIRLLMHVITSVLMSCK